VYGDSGYESVITFEVLGVSSTSDILVIDPQLVWGTFYGGANNADGPFSVDTDPSGNVFIAGYSYSNDFPVYNPGGGAYFQGTKAGGITDAMIMKFTNSGVRLWATYYGGNNQEWGYFVAIDGAGNAFVTGNTASNDFPVHNPGGSAYFQGTNAGIIDAFILKFTNSGVLQWATYYGGNDTESGYSLAVDGTGNVFVTGYTQSSNFPVQNPGGGAFYQATNASVADVFILKFTNSGIRLWATYYGGILFDYGHSVAVDGTGNVFVTGYTSSTNFPVFNPGGGAFYQGTRAGSSDAFILKFTNSGVRQWATYYGGSDDDAAYPLVVDGTGNVFVLGRTFSTNFPVFNPGGGAFYQGTHAGGFDAFILKFTNSGVRQWATYYGGTGNESMTEYDNIEVDACGNVYVGFRTTTSSFPHLLNSCDQQYYDDSYNGGTTDVILSLFSNTGALLWCTYVGGDGTDFQFPLAVDVNNNLFASGEWTNVSNSTSYSYSLVNPGGGAYFDDTFNGGTDDGFILKFLPVPCPCPPLPHYLISLHAQWHNSQQTQALLSWQVQGDAATNQFVVERKVQDIWQEVTV
ncbi:MAG: SBBP repeat-containing protein, partial [Bacteroidia bacterium]|nr:SBBP repeat-containing protein [Bacteroidia bacterium]